MKMRHTLAGALAFALSASAAFAAGKGTVIEGYVAHGVNVYNEKFIADYGDVGTIGVPWFTKNSAGEYIFKIREIGALSPFGGDAEPIDETTPPDTPVATISDFARFFGADGVTDPALYNRTLNEIGSNFFPYAGVLDNRVTPTPFDEAEPGDLYRGSNHNGAPTVGEWNRVKGRMRVKCHADGTATAEVALRDAFPDGVYTLWDIGVTNPLQADEGTYAAPFGGVPNVLMTDSEGCGYRRIELPFCPTRSCVGNDSCGSYVSAFYHWDNQVYGGAPAATFAGLPAGVVAANQVIWPTTGTVNFPPPTEFPGQKMTCGPAEKTNATAGRG